MERKLFRRQGSALSLQPEEARKYPGTREMGSNGSISFGFRRRYSFESFELKEGSSSGTPTQSYSRIGNFLQLPRFPNRILPRMTTLEPIPPSPTPLEEEDAVNKRNDERPTTPPYSSPAENGVTTSETKVSSQEPSTFSIPRRGSKGEADQSCYNYWSNGDDTSFDKVILSPSESANFLFDEFFYELLVVFHYFKMIVNWLAHFSKEPLASRMEIAKFIKSLTLACCNGFQLNYISFSRYLKNCLKKRGKDQVSNYAEGNGTIPGKIGKVGVRVTLQLLVVIIILAIGLALSVMLILPNFSSKNILDAPILQQAKVTDKRSSSHSNLNKCLSPSCWTGTLSLRPGRSFREEYQIQQELQYDSTHESTNAHGLVAQRGRTCDSLHLRAAADDSRSEEELEQRQEQVLNEDVARLPAQLYSEEQAVWLVLSVLFAILSSSCSFTLFLVYLYRHERFCADTSSFQVSRDESQSPLESHCDSVIKEGGLVQGYGNRATSSDPVGRGHGVKRASLAVSQEPDQYYLCQQSCNRIGRGGESPKIWPAFPRSTRGADDDKVSDGKGGPRERRKCLVKRKIRSCGCGCTPNNISTCFLCTVKKDDVSGGLAKAHDERKSILPPYCYCCREDITREDCCGANLLLTQNCEALTYCPYRGNRTFDNVRNGDDIQRKVGRGEPNGRQWDYPNNHGYHQACPRNSKQVKNSCVEQVGRVVDPKGNSSHSHYTYFVDKFSHPDKVLFPLFWTALLVDFHFPNCSLLLQASVLGVAIKFINLFHHYSYFARFRGGPPQPPPPYCSAFIIEETVKKEESQVSTLKEKGFLKGIPFATRQEDIQSHHNSNHCLNWTCGKAINNNVSSKFQKLDEHQSLPLLFLSCRNNLLWSSSKLTVSLWLYSLLVQRLGVCFLHLVSSWWSFESLLILELVVVFTHFLQIVGLFLGQLCAESLSPRWESPTNFTHQPRQGCLCCGRGCSSDEGSDNKRLVPSHQVKRKCASSSSNLHYSPVPNEPFISSLPESREQREWKGKSESGSLPSSFSPNRNILSSKNQQAEWSKVEKHNQTRKNYPSGPQFHNNLPSSDDLQPRKYSCNGPPLSVLRNGSNGPTIRNRLCGEHPPPQQKRISFYLHEPENGERVKPSDPNWNSIRNGNRHPLILRYENRQRRAVTSYPLANSNEGRSNKSLSQLLPTSDNNLKEKGDSCKGILILRANGIPNSASSSDTDTDSALEEGSLSKSSSSGSLVLPDDCEQQKGQNGKVVVVGKQSYVNANDANNNGYSDTDKSVNCTDEIGSEKFSRKLTSCMKRPLPNPSNEVQVNGDLKNATSNNYLSSSSSEVKVSSCKDSASPHNIINDKLYRDEVSMRGVCGSIARFEKSGDIGKEETEQSAVNSSFLPPQASHPNHMNCKSLSKKSSTASGSGFTSTTRAKLKSDGSLINRRRSTTSINSSSNSGIDRAPTPPPPSIRSTSIFANVGGGGRERKTFISHHHKYIGPAPGDSPIPKKDEEEAPPVTEDTNEFPTCPSSEHRTRGRQKTTIICSSRVIPTASNPDPLETSVNREIFFTSYNDDGLDDEGNCKESGPTTPVAHPKPPSSLIPTSSQVTSQSSSVSSKRLFTSGSQCCVNSSASSSPVQQVATPPYQIGHNQQHSERNQSVEKYLGNKMRRTSLPALPAQRTGILHHGSAGVDTALLYEAHGLVTEMLVDQAALPANVVAGLKALATLLKPTPTSTIHYPTPRPKPMPLTLSIDPDYTSDIDEIPYTGEKISTLPKRNSGQGKKGVTANILRRMSTSTWTTTTSATGMPTLEPQPHTRRRRSASFRSSALGPSHRRFSQHELSTRQHLEHGQRKTVCSLHPLSPSDLTHLSALAASTGFFPSGSNTIKSASASVSAAGSNRSSPASTPIPSPIPSPVPSRDPSPCNHRRTSGNGGSSSSGGRQDFLGSSEHIGPNGSTLLFQQRNSPSQSAGNLLSLNNNSKIGTNGGTSGSAFSSSSALPCSSSQCASPTTCRQHHPRDYSPPKVLFHSTGNGKHEPAFTVLGGNGNGGGLVEGDSLGLLSGKNPDEDNCSTTSTLGDGPGPPDNSSGNSNSLRLSPVTFTLQEPPDINEPYFSADDDAQQDLVVTSDGIRFDLQSIAVDPLLCRLHEWDYPIFDLERSSRTQILSHMCYKVFLETGLFETFRIPIKEFITYFHALELGYRDKPYHNRMHASDVLHGVYYLTSQAIPGFQMVPPDPETPSASDISGQRAWFSVEEASYGIMGANFTSLELMAMYVAAAMHDYDHPGRTNAFLVSTHAKEAILYNDRSVLENHHAAAAWSLLMSSDDCNFLKYLDKAEFKRFRYLVIEAILATDLKRHFEIVAEFNSKVNEDDSPGIDWTQEDDRLLVMEICIKLADINGPCKVHDIHVQWTYRIAEEFYEQGDEEAELGLPISPFMDRDHPQLARLQESFINHLVAPLCKACAEAGVLPGYWIEDQEASPEADNDGDKGEEGGEHDLTTADDLSVATTSCQETDNENDELSYSDDNPTNFCNRVIGGGTHSSKRRIFCLQTKHLQDNHKHWMGVIKEESKKKDEGPPPVKTESVAISTEDPMETIEEENNTPHSLNRSFSFEKEDSKL